MIGLLVWLLQAAAWTLIVVHALGFITAMRARRWVRAPTFEWSGMSEAMAAQVVAEHLAAVQDDFFAFPTGTFAAHPSQHRPRDGTIVMVEQYPDDRAAFSGLDVWGVLVGAVEVAEVLASILCYLAKIVGILGGAYYGAIWIGGSIHFLGLGSVMGVILGALAGWFAGKVVGGLIAVLFVLALVVVGAAMLPVTYLLLRVHRAAFRSRIEGRVKAGAGLHDVSIELRFRGLSAYAVHQHVMNGVGPPSLQAPGGRDFKHDPGLQRVGRLGLEALGSSVLLTVFGLFVVV